MELSRKNIFIDFLKGIGCLGVVLIHVSFPGNFGAVVSRLAQFAVPVFLMISGFYAYNADPEVIYKNVKRRLKRIAKLTVIVLILYAFLGAILSVLYGGFSSYIKNIFSFKNILNMLVLNNFDAIGAGHIWFLPALLYSYVFLLLVNKYKKYKLCIFCCLYCLWHVSLLQVILEVAIGICMAIFY